jgi:hypothetical protein
MIVGLTGRRVLCIRNYVVYFDISLLQLAVCCAAVYLIAVTADTLRRRRSETIGRYRAVFRMGNFVKELPAFSDTGNLLRDSFTGAPVMIFRSDELYRRFDLWGEGFDWYDCKRWGITLKRKSRAEGGSWMKAYAITLGPQDANQWTWIIPERETEYNGALKNKNTTSGEK